MAATRCYTIATAGRLWGRFLTLLVCISGGFAHGQVFLTWIPSPDPTVAGYYLCWGTKSRAYAFTNACSTNQTNCTVSTLMPDTMYYFAVQAVGTNKMVSPFSNEVIVSNGPPPSNGLPEFVSSTNGPPPPTNSGGSSPPIVSGNGGSTASSGVTNYASRMWGVPPFLEMTLMDGQPILYVGGTVGADLLLQSATNLGSPDGWETMTNLLLTNVATSVLSNEPAQTPNALDIAYVPATQAFPVASGNSASVQFLRVVMPYDYAILGSVVLRGKGYAPRLIIVNMPGIVRDDACYLNEGSSFIHYDSASTLLELLGSGSTIRQIADTLSASLDVNWTSASEFVYTNGQSQIVATVIKTEPPTSDPVPGKAPPAQPVVIDF